MRFLISMSALALAGVWPAGAGAQEAVPTTSPAPPTTGQADPFATPPALNGSGASAAAPTPDATQRDPLEKFNRSMWDLNQGVDRIALKPAAQAYRFVTPRPVRRGISHIFSNLTEPWSFVNNVLQLKIGRAFNNLGRFVINTTIGVGGLADHATGLGLKPTPEDFGLTLAHYGARSSPYLVLPFLGPSTIRDGIGTGVAFFADPVPICIKQCTNLNFIERTGIQGVRLLSVRSDLIESGADAFLESSLDPYASARSAFFQSRAIEIEDGDAMAAPAKPGSVDPTLGTAPPAAADQDPFATPPSVPADSPPAATPPAANPAPAPAAPAVSPDKPSASREPDAAPRLAVAMNERLQ